MKFVLLTLIIFFATLAAAALVALGEPGELPLLLPSTGGSGNAG